MFIYQVWALCTSGGAGVMFQPYCGRHTLIEDVGLGQGPNVVLGLVGQAKLSPGSMLFFDNLFTSFPLLEKLSDQGMAGTGTMRQNRLHKVPIMAKKEVEKKTIIRGFSQAIFKADQVLTVWKDNKPVYLASNKFDAVSSTTCRRYCRTERKTLQVPFLLFLLSVFFRTYQFFISVTKSLC